MTERLADEEGRATGRPIMPVHLPAPARSRAAEVAAKVAAVREWLAMTGLPAVVLTRPGSLAWIGAGLTDPIERGAAIGLVFAVVTPSRASIVTTNVEAPRLEGEETVVELGFSLHSTPWHDPDRVIETVESIVGWPRSAIASDGHPGFGVDADMPLTGLRITLTAPEIDRLRLLGRDAAQAVERAVRSWQPGEHDLDVQARIAAGLEADGVFAACLIVGGDERVERFRHPIAVGAPMRRLVMAVVVGERQGLHVALTRFASVAEPGSRLTAADARVRAIERHVLDACRPGATYGHVVGALANGYAEVGAPEAWREHYQGGPVGYRQREFEIAPGQVDSPWWDRPVASGDAIAYNPSLTGGGKIEDTFLVTGDGPELITTTNDWPTIPLALSSGRVIPRPAILQISR